MFPPRWRISDPVLIAETATSRVWRVTRDDGSPAIVKDLKPYGAEDELRGGYFLRWRRGEGAVLLLGRDGPRLLLEYAGERTLAEVLKADGDDAATDIAAEVMARLHRPSQHPAPPQLSPLDKWFAALFRKARADRDAGTPYIWAAELAARLLADQRDLRPLHGDLHHENILSGPRGWLAIDPKGLIGDPCFDAANFFYNPYGRDDLCLDGTRIAAMARVFAAMLRRDVRDVLDYAAAYGCLKAAWSAEIGNDEDEKRELAISAAISDVKLTA